MSSSCGQWPVRPSCGQTAMWLCLILVVAAAVPSAAHAQRSSVASYSDQASVTRKAVEILPFRWFFADRQVLLDPATVKKALNAGDPLRAAELAYRLLLLGHEKPESRVAANDRAMQLLDHLIAEYQPAERTPEHLLLKYRFPTDKLAAGWWSAMDGLLFPLVLLDAAILTGEQRYRAAATRAIRAITRDVSAGGSVLRNDNSGCWLSAYTWSGMAAADEYYVLNGHLYGLHALFLYAQQSADPAARALLQCAIKGTTTHFAKFRRAGLDGTHYMLHPKTINQTHYMIFEKMQLDALYELTGLEEFKAESEYRSRVLQIHHQLRYLPRASGKGVTVVFAKNAPPHPYNLDTYGIRLRCLDPQGQILSALPHSASTTGTVAGRRRFITVDLSQVPATCTVESVAGNNAVKLFDAKPSPAATRSVQHFHNYAVTAIHDAVVQSGRNIQIRPANVSSPSTPSHSSNSEGRIIVSGLHLGQVNEIFGVELFSEAATNLGIGLVDSGGKEFFRYYPALKAGTINLVLLSPLGFDNIEDAVVPFKSLNVYVYTPNSAAAAFGMRVGDIWVSDDRAALMLQLQKKLNLYIPHDD